MDNDDQILIHNYHNIDNVKHVEYGKFDMFNNIFDLFDLMKMIIIIFYVKNCLIFNIISPLINIYVVIFIYMDDEELFQDQYILSNLKILLLII